METNNRNTTQRGAYYADKKRVNQSPHRPSGAHYAPQRSWAESIFAGDKALWVVIVMLLIYSLFVVYSTTAYDPALNANQELTKQLLFIGIGMAAFFFMQSFHPRTYRPLIKIIYWPVTGSSDTDTIICRNACNTMAVTTPNTASPGKAVSHFLNISMPL